MEEAHPSPDIAQTRLAAGQACAVLRVLAREDRPLPLCQLSQGAVSVNELEEALDMRQSTLSRRLGVLRNEGLAATRREGKRIYHSIADPQMLVLLGTLYTPYCPRPDAANTGERAA